MDLIAVSSELYILAIETYICNRYINTIASNFVKLINIFKFVYK